MSLREQRAIHTVSGQPIRGKGHVPSAARHMAGHSAGFHPEDTPWMTEDTGDMRDIETEEEEMSQASYDDLWEEDNPPRPPTSAIRYRPMHPMRVTDESQPPAILRASRTASARYTTQTGETTHRYALVPTTPAARTRSSAPPTRTRGSLHPLLWLGVIGIFCVLGWMGLSAAATWLQHTRDDWTYGMPRTYQTDQVVGHGDSDVHPSHFIAVNLHGDIEVIELPRGDPTRARVYPVIHFGAGHEDDVVTLSFADTNHDGRLDMTVSIEGFTVLYLNTGTGFQLPRP